MARMILGLGLFLSVSFLAGPRGAAAGSVGVESDASPTPTAPTGGTASGVAEGAPGEMARERAATGAATPTLSGAATVDIPALIIQASFRYGLEPDRMLRIAWCESRWNPSAVGRGGATGVFQFMWYTWRWASVAAGYADASPYDPVANIEVASWLMATEGARHWTCR